MPEFTSKDFRSTVGAFATGVTVVTTRGEEHAYGMTANAFSSVSLDPPLVLVCVISPSEGCEHIRRNRCFAVNVLGVDQEPISRYFASRDRPRGRDAFREVRHRVGSSGSPILDGAIGYLDCRSTPSTTPVTIRSSSARYWSSGFEPYGEPLLFHGGSYKLVMAASYWGFEKRRAGNVTRLGVSARGRPRRRGSSRSWKLIANVIERHSRPPTPCRAKHERTGRF